MDVLTIEEAELYHHGIKGMRWGIRRYQNPDGSLTPAGKKRYMQDAKFRYKWAKMKEKDAAKKKAAEESEAKKNETPEQRHARLLKSNNANELMKHINELSTDEIRERTNRIQAERTLAQYMTHEPTKMERAVAKVEKVSDMASRVVKTLDSPAGKMARKFVKDKLGVRTQPQTNVNYRDFLNNVSRMTNQQVQDMQRRAQNEENVRRAIERIQTLEDARLHPNRNQNQNQNQQRPAPRSRHRMRLRRNP